MSFSVRLRPSSLRRVRPFLCAALLGAAAAAQSFTLYVDPASGSNANNGLTLGAALKSVTFALGLPGVATAQSLELRLAPGVYTTPDETFPLAFAAGGNLTTVVTAVWTEPSSSGPVAFGWPGAAKILNPATGFGALSALVGPGVPIIRFEGIDFASPAGGVRIEPATNEQTSATFVDCTFRGTSGIRSTPAADFVGVLLEVAHCVFAGPATTNSTAVRFDGSPAGVSWLWMDRCRIADYNRGVDLRTETGGIAGTGLTVCSFARCTNAAVRLARDGAFGVVLPVVHCVFDACGNATAGTGGGIVELAPPVTATGLHLLYIAGCAFRANVAETPNFGVGYVAFQCCAQSAATVALWATAGPLFTNIFGDPLFVDPAALDFRLRPGSPCIDAGPQGNLADADLDGDPFPYLPPPPALPLTDIGVDQFYAPHTALREHTATPGAPITCVLTGPGGAAYLLAGLPPANTIWGGGFQLQSPLLVIPITTWPVTAGVQQQVINLGALGAGGPLATVALQAVFVPTGFFAPQWSLSVPKLTLTP